MNENKITIARIALSTNPLTPTEVDTNGVSGKVNLTADGRKFVVVHLEDRTNPMSFVRRAFTYSTNDSGQWPALSPAKMIEKMNSLAQKDMELTIPGQSMTFHTNEYEINGRKVSTKTIIVLEKENPLTVLRNSSEDIHSYVDEASGQLTKLPEPVVNTVSPTLGG